MPKTKKVGLPDFVKNRPEHHLVDEITRRTKTTIIRNIPIEKLITNTIQPRKDFGDLEELKESIVEKGILEPILVRPKDGFFEIIAGERRFRAAQMAGNTQVPCIEFDIPDNEALEISIIENIQRKNLDIFEHAFSLKSLSDIYGYTHQEIAKKLGKSRVTVTELIRITDLPPEVLIRCQDLKIESKTFLTELVKLDDSVKMIAVLDEYQKNPLSRDQVKDFRNENEEQPVSETEQGDQVEKTPGLPRRLKFHFTSEDKALKLDFNIKANGMNREKLVFILENLINDIKEGKIGDLPF